MCVAETGQWLEAEPYFYMSLSALLWLGLERISNRQIRNEKHLQGCHSFLFLVVENEHEEDPVAASQREGSTRTSG
jgi:sulfur transfer protein SufE